MKIYYITNSRLPTEKAHGWQIMKTCEALVNLGLDIELIVPERQNSISLDPFEYYGLEPSFKIQKVKHFDVMIYEFILGRVAYYLQGLGFLIKLLFIDLSKQAWIYTRSVEIAWLFSILGSKTIYEAHAWPVTKNRLYLWLLRKVKLIVANSQGTANEFSARGCKQVLVAANGVDLGGFINIPNKTVAREELNWPANKAICLYTGHFYTWKGIDVILAAAELSENNENLVFVLVGGTDSDYKKYQAKIIERKLTNVWLISHQTHNQILKYLSAADILLLPNVSISAESEKYTSPIKVFEYLAVGRPIVASDLPAIREILNENNAILVKAGDEPALLQGIKKIIADESLAVKLSQCGLDDVKKYTWKARAEKIYQAILQLK